MEFREVLGVVLRAVPCWFGRDCPGHPAAVLNGHPLVQLPCLVAYKHLNPAGRSGAVKGVRSGAAVIIALVIPVNPAHDRHQIAHNRR